MAFKRYLHLGQPTVHFLVGVLLVPLQGATGCFPALLLLPQQISQLGHPRGSRCGNTNSTGEPQGGWWALGPWVHNLPRSHMEVELNFRVPSEGKAPNKGEQEGGVPSSQQCGTNGRGQPTGGTRGTGQGRPETLNVHTKLDNPGNWPT